MKALQEIGVGKATRFLVYQVLMVIYSLLVFPQLRSFYLRLLGARIGKNTIIHNVRFFNLYRTGMHGFSVGEDCFIGDDCLFDLADAVELKDKVTLAERVLVLTHMNVGYRDHPLQKYFPALQKKTVFEQGCFVGAGSTILAGVTVGKQAFVAAGSVVTKDVLQRTLVAGVPAKVLRKIQ